MTDAPLRRDRSMRSTQWLMKPCSFLAFLLTTLLTPAPAASADPLLTPDERRWLAEHPRFRLAPDPSFPPFEFFDQRGEYQGMAADYVRLLESRLGIEFQVSRHGSWSDVLKGAQEGTVDVLAAAMASPKRE
ncbi:MAG: transporter substrate-binding domain-containing protein, partial [Planctomycetota bacterium]